MIRVASRVDQCVAGARVQPVVSEGLPAGEHARAWSGEIESGKRAPQGLYFVRFRAAGVTMTGKLFLISP